MSDPILYSFRRCPYAIRARLALAVSGARYQKREVVLSRKPAELLAVSPRGTVPCLVLVDGGVIAESMEIMQWALAMADPEAWLARHDPALVAMFDDTFKHHLDRYKYPDRYRCDPLAHRDSALALLCDLDRRLARCGQLCGSTRGLADIAIMPFVRQFAAVDRLWFEAQPVPHLHQWLEGHLTSDLFDAVMDRAAAWAPGDRPVIVDGREVDGREADEREADERGIDGRGGERPGQQGG